MYLALGLVALVVVGYLLYSRSRSGGATGTSPFSTGSPTTPSADTSGDSGGGTSSGSPLDDPASALLSTLAGENQSLIGALLGGGAAQTQSQPVGAPQNSTTSEPATATSAGSVQPAAGIVAGPNGPSALGLSDVTSTDLAAPGSPLNQTVNYMENVPTSTVSGTPQSFAPVADQIASTFYTAPSAPAATKTLNYDIPSGAGAVKSGGAKVNYQAKARAT